MMIAARSPSIRGDGSPAQLFEPGDDAAARTIPRFRIPMTSSPTPSPSVHFPVLLREVVSGLELAPGLTVVDGTLGGGGHSRELLKQIVPGGRLLGIDRDPMMLDLARPTLLQPEVSLQQGSYADLP